MVKGRNTTQKHIENSKETDLNIKNKYITNVYQKLIKELCYVIIKYKINEMKSKHS